MESGLNSSELTNLRASVEIQDSRERNEGLSLVRGAFVIAKAAVGAAMLNFPEAFRKTGGVAQAMTVQICIAVLIYGAFCILGYCSQVSRSSLYQETVGSLCGESTKRICEIVIILAAFFPDVAYLILIGDQLEKVINQPGWYFNRKFIIPVVSCLIILPLCIPKKLKAISYASLISSLGALYTCVMVAIQYYSGRYSGQKASSYSHPQHHRWTGVFAALPAICAGFDCHLIAVAVYGEMKRPTMKRFGVVTCCATLIFFFIYSVTGIFGFLTFGDNVKDDILLNYDPDDDLVNAARYLVCIIVIACYAIQLFNGRSAFIGLWNKLWGLTREEAERFQDRRRIITTIVWFFSSLGLAIAVPSIQKIVDIIGGLAAVIMFTFPGLCLIQVILKERVEQTIKNKLGLVVGVAYVTIGVFLSGHVMTQTLMK